MSINGANNSDNDLRIKLIKKQLLFASLSDNAIESIANLMHEVSYKENALIVKEGEIVDSFFFIISGKAIVSKKNDREARKLPGELTFIETLNTGDAIGLSSKGFYSPTGRRMATVTAGTDIQLFRISVLDFSSLIKNSSEFGEQLQSFAEYLTKLDFLKQASPFNHVSHDKICEMSEKIISKHLEKGSVLFSQGEPADCCYLINKGIIEIFVESDDKREKLLAQLDVGTLFGETALLSSSLRNASARAATPCDLYVLPYDLMIQLFRNNEPVVESFIGLMVKRARPVHHEEVTVHQRNRSDGSVFYLLHNAQLAQVYRLTEEGLSIWQLIDGHNTIHDITIAFYKEHHIFCPEMICNFIYSLAELGFIKAPDVCMDLHAEKKWFVKRILNYFHGEWMFNNIDPHISNLFQKGAWLFFKWPLQLLMMITVVSGITLFFKFNFTMQHLVQVPHYLLALLFILFLSSIIIAAFHELAHALTTKYFGYQVQRIGVMWFYFSPVAFVDTSEIWLADRWSRVAVDVAGIYWDCFAASCLAIVAYFIANTGVAEFLWLIALMIYVNSFRNLSPIREYDGYFVLADAWDKPKLNELSFAWLANTLPRLFRDPKTVFLRHKPEVSYSMACCLYLAGYFFIIYFMLQFFFKSFSVHDVLHIPVNYLSMAVAAYSVFMPLVFMVRSIASARKRDHA